MKMHSNKMYYTIGEVSKLLGVEPHILRYWEKEFTVLSPRRIRGRRKYTPKDIDLLRKIKKLLYEDGFTVEGARKALEGKVDKDIRGIIEMVEKELQDIYRLLGGDDEQSTCEHHG